MPVVEGFALRLATWLPAPLLTICVLLCLSGCGTSGLRPAFAQATVHELPGLWLYQGGTREGDQSYASLSREHLLFSRERETVG